MKRFLMAAGLAIMMSIPAGTQAQSTTSISISAQTEHKDFGFIWTVYGSPAHIIGRVGTGQAGVAVVLRASKFPFASFSVVRNATTGVGGIYAFRIRPARASHYQVALASDPTSTSPIVTVYVGERGVTVSPRCGNGPVCNVQVSADDVYPSAVATREGAKVVYFYFLHMSLAPHLPPLNFVQTVRQHFVGGNRFQYSKMLSFPNTMGVGYLWMSCTKDTEAADGLGLPGHHGCGGRSVTWNSYVG